MTTPYKIKVGWTTAFFFAAFCLATMYSCKKENVKPYIEKGAILFEGRADSSQMVPLLAVGSPGSATFTARYDNNLHILNYFLKWQNMTSGVTRADMYFPSNAVSNGLLTRTLFSSATPRTAVVDSINGAIAGTYELTESELADLKAGKIYYTITTQTNLGGEIRGQISVKK